MTSKTREHLSIKELERGVASYPGPLCDEGPGYEARGRGYGCIVCYMIWPQYLETTIMHCRPLHKNMTKTIKTNEHFQRVWGNQDAQWGSWVPWNSARALLLARILPRVDDPRRNTTACSEPVAEVNQWQRPCSPIIDQPTGWITRSRNCITANSEGHFHCIIYKQWPFLYATQKMAN